jgi:outer membrane immunogenic protein
MMKLLGDRENPMGAVMKRFALTAATILACAGGSAGAADLPVKAAPAPAPAYSWTGCHVGINGGGKWGFVRGAEYFNAATGPAGPSAPAAFTFDNVQTPTGTGIGGGQVGCDYQIGYGVFGVEGDADWQRFSQSTGVGPVVPGDKLTFTSRWESSLRARAGYTSDRTLIYATGGVAWTDAEAAANFVPVAVGGVGLPGTINSDRQTLIGWTAGAGLEFAVTNNLIVGLEGRYTLYDGKNFDIGSVAGAGAAPGPFTLASSTAGVRLSTAEIIARVNWKFDWLGGPVVARY